jgi:hypothetical protein
MSTEGGAGATEIIFPEVEKLRRRLQGLGCPWWVTGGWAIDMFLGRQTRPHADIEIAIARADQGRLLMLPGMGGIEYVEAGEKKPWRGQRLELPVHELHARIYTGETFEALLNEFDAADWIYRRNPAIRLPRTRFAGTAHLPIEAVLLYKSKNPRPQDAQDFLAALKYLDAAQMGWLAAAIERDDPAHLWLKKLKAGPGLTAAARDKF